MQEPSWINIQTKTFTRFVNKHLEKSNLSIKNLEADFENGVALIKLIEALSNKSVGTYNKNPRFISQKLENVTKALDLIHLEGIKLVNIDSSHIVKQNLKLILGLIWALILHYSLSFDKHIYEAKENSTPKEKLLTWVTNKTEIPITNFTTQWNDGKIVGSLVDSFKPGLCPNWRYWDGSRNLENTTEAMETAQNWLSVPMLITPEEIISPKVDEKSVMTYVAQFGRASVKEGAPLKRPEPPFKAVVCSPGFNMVGVTGEVYQICVHVTQSIPNTDIEMTVETEFGSELPVNVESEEGDYYVCSCVPPKAGSYVASIKYDYRNISSDPFQFYVESSFDVGQVFVGGRGIRAGLTDVNNYFRIFTDGESSFDGSDSSKEFFGTGGSEMEEPLVSVSYSYHGWDQQIPVVVKRIGEGEYQCKYKPTVPGTHLIAISFNGVPHPESPISVNVEKSLDPTLFSVSGKGCSRIGQRVGDKNKIWITSATAVNCTPKVTVIDPHNKIIYSADKVQENTWRYIFEPTKVGPHRIHIKTQGIELQASPFIVDVLPESQYSYDVFGPGLERLFVDRRTNFITCLKPGQSIPECNILGPESTEVQITQLSKNLVIYSYEVTKPGNYEIYLTVKGKDVKNSPFSLKTETPSIDPSKIIIRGLSKDTYFMTGRTQSFCVDATQYRRNLDLEFISYSIEGGELEISSSAKVRNDFNCSYKSRNRGNYCLWILCNKSLIGESPYSMSCLDPILPRNFQIYGSGVEENPNVGEETEFYVDLRNYPETLNSCDFLQARLISANGEIIPCRIRQKTENFYVCSYVPTISGDYKLDLRFFDEPLPGRAYSVAVKDVFDPNLCSISPVFDRETQVNLELNFEIISRNETNPELFFVVTSPDGLKTKVLLNATDSIYNCYFLPKATGRYSVDIRYLSEPLPGSPFDILVRDRDSFYFWGSVMRDIYANVPGFFVVGSKNLMVDKYKFEISGPSNASITTVDSMSHYFCANIIEIPLQGLYYLHVFADHKEIPQSPLKLEVKPEPEINYNLFKVVGLESKDTVEYGEHVKFLIEGFGAQANKRDFKILCHSKTGQVTPMNIKQTTTQIIQCDFYVRKRWNIITIEYKNIPLFLSPYILKIPRKTPPVAIEISPKQKIKVGGPMVISITRPTQDIERFVDSSSEGDENAFDADGFNYYIINDEIKEIVEVKGKNISFNQVDCLYIPPLAGFYTLIVNYNDKNISNYRFTVDEAFDASECRTRGRGLSSRGIRVDEESEFTVILPTDDNSLLSVFGEKPGGSKLFVDPQPSKEVNEFNFQYIPRSVGYHKISVLFDGENVAGSPFTVEVSPPSKYSIEMIVPSVSSGYVGFPVVFFHESTAEIDNLDFYLRGPSKSMIKRCDYGKYGKNCYFVPTVAGEYVMRISYKNEDIHNSPFHINVMENPGFSPEDVNIKRNDNSFLPIGSKMQFDLDLPDSVIDNEFSANVYQDYKFSQKIPFKRDRYSNKSSYELLADQNAVFITYRGVPVHSEPNIFYGVRKGQPEDIRVFGPCFEDSAVQNEETNCFIDCSEGGYGDLNFYITDDLHQEVNLDFQKEEEIYNVGFTPKRGGEYRLFVFFDGKSIPGCPLSFSVNSLEDISKIIIKNPPSDTFIGFYSKLIVDYSEFDNFSIDHLKARVLTPQNGFHGTKIVPFNEYQCHVVYILKNEGDYKIFVSYKDSQIGFSPVRITGNAGFDPSLVSVYGNGMYNALVNTVMNFTIDGCDAGSGGVTCTISGPTDLINGNIKTNENGTEDVTYVPSVAGNYNYSVKLRDIDIDGSPFNVTIYDIIVNNPQNIYFVGNPCIVTAKTSLNCPLEFQVLNPADEVVDANTSFRKSTNEFIVSWTPTVRGYYKLQAFQTIHNQSSILSTFAVYDKSCVEVQKIEETPASLTNEFYIVTRNAGKYELNVSIKSENEESLFNTVSEVKEGQYKVSYTPEDIGSYFINVEYGGVNVFSKKMTARATGNPSMITKNDEFPKVVCYGKETELVFDTSRGGEGNLLCNTWDENGRKSKVRTEKREKTTVAYFNPPNCGDCKLEFKFGGQPLQIDPVEISVITEEYYNCLHTRGFDYVEFTIPLFEYGNEQIHVVIPSGEYNRFDDVNFADDQLYLKYQPKTAGKYKILNIPIKLFNKTPEFEFYINEGNSPLKAYGQGLTIGFVNEPCAFFLEGEKAIKSSLESAIDIIGPSKADVVCKKIEENISKIEYFLTKPGKYLIKIVNNGNQIPGSPFNVVILDSVPISTDSQLICPTSMLLESKGKYPLKSLEVFAISPSNNKQECKIRELMDSHIIVDFLPYESGKHQFHVLSNGIPIENSPFEILISENVLADPFLVEVIPIGEGKIGYWNSFIVKTKNAGHGILSVKIKGPSKCEIKFKHLKNSSVEVLFRPEKSGCYEVTVKFQNEVVPKSPFIVNVGDESIYEVSYLQTPRYYIGKPCMYSLEIQDCSVNELSCTVTDSANNQRPCAIKEVGKNKFDVNFTPRQLGEYKVNIFRKGIPLSGSPFLFSVGPITSNNLKLNGSGLSGGKTNSPCVFNVYTHGLEAGNFGVSVYGPSKATVRFDKEYNDDYFQVSYTVSEPGTYKIFIYHNNEKTSDSPYIVQIVDGQETGSVTLQNDVNSLIPGTPTVFIIENIRGEITPYVNNPSKQVEECSISKIRDDSYCIEYIPKIPGIHQLHVLADGENLPQSPLNFTVAKSMVKSDKISMSGPGLKMISLDKENTFTVNVDEEIEGNLYVTIDGPSNAVIQCDDVQSAGNSSYVFTYNVDSTGDYLISIKVSDKFDETGEYASHIKNSPQIVSTMDSKGFSSKYNYRATYMVPLLKRIENEEENLTPGTVKIYGLSPCKPCGVEHSLQIATDGSDQNRLMVGMLSEEKKMFEFKVKQDKDDLFNVDYFVTKPGKYSIVLEFNGKTVNGSPFSIEFY